MEKTREEADKIDELKKEKDEEWGVPQKMRVDRNDSMCIYPPPKKKQDERHRGFGKKTLMAIVCKSFTVKLEMSL